MDLSKRTENFENFVLVQGSLTKSWFDLPITQMPIFIFYVSAGVLFEGTFSLWVSLGIIAKLPILDVCWVLQPLTILAKRSMIDVWQGSE